MLRLSSRKIEVMTLHDARTLRVWICFAGFSGAEVLRRPKSLSSDFASRKKRKKQNENK